MADQITSETWWFVVLDEGAPVAVCIEEHDAHEYLEDEGFSGPIIQVRPVLDDDVFEFRRGVEAARGLVKQQFILGPDEPLTNVSNNLIHTILRSIDRLLARASKACIDNDDSANH